MIEYVDKDILDASFGILCQGCNNKGVMGAGLALQIAKKWPIVKDVYVAEWHQIGFSLGDVQFVTVSPTLMVANCLTQQSYGRSQGVRYVDYNAIELCLWRVFETANFGLKIVHMPKIGCSLGGGDWNIVGEIVERVDRCFDIKTYIYSGVFK